MFFNSLPVLPSHNLSGITITNSEILPVLGGSIEREVLGLRPFSGFCLQAEKKILRATKRYKKADFIKEYLREY